jgi:hypothetical protein
VIALLLYIVVALVLLELMLILISKNKTGDLYQLSVESIEEL